MKVVGSVKQEHIVEAAIKRFSHFGVNKTSLTEIAEDIGISKPSLFYYFRDKNSLLEAVGQQIVNEFLDGFEAALTSARSVEEGLLNYVEVKRQHFKKYSLLALQADSIEMSKVPSQLSGVIIQARKRTQSLISDLLQKGIQQNTLRPVDVEKITLLLIEILEAFEHCLKNKTALLENKNIDALFDKQQEVILMILNGLKISEWKN